jgi:hypothetical protein
MLRVPSYLSKKVTSKRWTISFLLTFFTGLLDTGSKPPSLSGAAGSI